MMTECISSPLYTQPPLPFPLPVQNPWRAARTSVSVSLYQKGGKPLFLILLSSSIIITTSTTYTYDYYQPSYTYTLLRIFKFWDKIEVYTKYTCVQICVEMLGVPGGRLFFSLGCRSNEAACGQMLKTLPSRRHVFPHSTH